MKFTLADSFSEGLARSTSSARRLHRPQGKMAFEAPFDVSWGFHKASCW